MGNLLTVAIDCSTVNFSDVPASTKDVRGATLSTVVSSEEAVAPAVACRCKSTDYQSSRLNKNLHTYLKIWSIEGGRDSSVSIRPYKLRSSNVPSDPSTSLFEREHFADTSNFPVKLNLDPEHSYLVLIVYAICLQCVSKIDRPGRELTLEGISLLRTCLTYILDIPASIAEDVLLQELSLQCTESIEAKCYKCPVIIESPTSSTGLGSQYFDAKSTYLGKLREDLTAGAGRNRDINKTSRLCYEIFVLNGIRSSLFSQVEAAAAASKLSSSLLQVRSSNPVAGADRNLTSYFASFASCRVPNSSFIKYVSNRKPHILYGHSKPYPTKHLPNHWKHNALIRHFCHSFSYFPPLPIPSDRSSSLCLQEDGVEKNEDSHLLSLGRHNAALSSLFSLTPMSLCSKHTNQNQLTSHELSKLTSVERRSFSPNLALSLQSVQNDLQNLTFPDTEELLEEIPTYEWDSATMCHSGKDDNKKPLFPEHFSLDQTTLLPLTFDSSCNANDCVTFSQKKNLTISPRSIYKAIASTSRTVAALAVSPRGVRSITRHSPQITLGTNTAATAANKDLAVNTKHSFTEQNKKEDLQSFLRHMKINADRNYKIDSTKVKTLEVKPFIPPQIQGIQNFIRTNDADSESLNASSPEMQKDDAKSASVNDIVSNEINVTLQTKNSFDLTHSPNSPSKVSINNPTTASKRRCCHWNKTNSPLYDVSSASSSLETSLPLNQVISSEETTNIPAIELSVNSRHCNDEKEKKSTLNHERKFQTSSTPVDTLLQPVNESYTNQLASKSFGLTYHENQSKILNKDVSPRSDSYDSSSSADSADFEYGHENKLNRLELHNTDENTKETINLKIDVRNTKLNRASSDSSSSSSTHTEEDYYENERQKIVGQNVLNSDNNNEGTTANKQENTVPTLRMPKLGLNNIIRLQETLVSSEPSSNTMPEIKLTKKSGLAFINKEPEKPLDQPLIESEKQLGVELLPKMATTAIKVTIGNAVTKLPSLSLNSLSQNVPSIKDGNNNDNTKSNHIPSISLSSKAFEPVSSSGGTSFPSAILTSPELPLTLMPTTSIDVPTLNVVVQELSPHSSAMLRREHKRTIQTECCQINEAIRLQEFKDLTENHKDQNTLETELTLDPDLMEASNKERLLSKYRVICSEVLPGGRIFISGAPVSQNLRILKDAGITHIINMAGDTCKNYFTDTYRYLTYVLQDTRLSSAEVQSILLLTLDYMADVLSQNDKHRILVHCREGVSRSATIVIAYLMWMGGAQFRDALEILRHSRPMCNPNTGFTYALLRFEKLLSSQRQSDSIDDDIDYEISGSISVSDLFSSSSKQFASFNPFSKYLKRPEAYCSPTPMTVTSPSIAESYSSPMFSPRLVLPTAVTEQTRETLKKSDTDFLDENAIIADELLKHVDNNNNSNTNNADSSTTSERSLFRMCIHHAKAPFMIALAVAAFEPRRRLWMPSPTPLDPRFYYILRNNEEIFFWRGRESVHRQLTDFVFLTEYLKQICLFEGRTYNHNIPWKLIYIKQNDEPQYFWDLLHPPNTTLPSLDAVQQQQKYVGKQKSLDESYKTFQQMEALNFSEYLWRLQSGRLNAFSLLHSSSSLMSSRKPPNSPGSSQRISINRPTSSQRNVGSNSRRSIGPNPYQSSSTSSLTKEAGESITAGGSDPMSTSGSNSGDGNLFLQQDSFGNDDDDNGDRNNNSNDDDDDDDDDRDDDEQFTETQTLNTPSSTSMVRRRFTVSQPRPLVDKLQLPSNSISAPSDHLEHKLASTTYSTNKNSTFRPQDLTKPSGSLFVTSTLEQLTPIRTSDKTPKFSLPLKLGIPEKREEQKQQTEIEGKKLLQSTSLNIKMNLLHKNVISNQHLDKHNNNEIIEKRYTNTSEPVSVRPSIVTPLKLPERKEEPFTIKDSFYSRSGARGSVIRLESEDLATEQDDEMSVENNLSSIRSTTDFWNGQGGGKEEEKVSEHSYYKSSTLPNQVIGSPIVTATDLEATVFNGIAMPLPTASISSSSSLKPKTKHNKKYIRSAPPHDFNIENNNSNKTFCSKERGNPSKNQTTDIYKKQELVKHHHHHHDDDRHRNKPNDNYLDSERSSYSEHSSFLSSFSSSSSSSPSSSSSSSSPSSSLPPSTLSLPPSSPISSISNISKAQKNRQQEQLSSRTKPTTVVTTDIRSVKVKEGNVDLESDIPYLYRWPKFHNPMDVFDADDLDSEGFFILVQYGPKPLLEIFGHAEDDDNNNNNNNNNTSTLSCAVAMIDHPCPEDDDNNNKCPTTTATTTFPPSLSSSPPFVRSELESWQKMRGYQFIQKKNNMSSHLTTLQSTSTPCLTFFLTDETNSPSSPNFMNRSIEICADSASLSFRKKRHPHASVLVSNNNHKHFYKGDTNNQQLQNTAYMNDDDNHDNNSNKDINVLDCKLISSLSYLSFSKEKKQTEREHYEENTREKEKETREQQQQQYAANYNTIPLPLEKTSTRSEALYEAFLPQIKEVEIVAEVTRTFLWIWKGKDWNQYQQKVNAPSDEDIVSQFKKSHGILPNDADVVEHWEEDGLESDDFQKLLWLS